MKAGAIPSILILLSGAMVFIFWAGNSRDSIEDIAADAVKRTSLAKKQAPPAGLVVNGNQSSAGTDFAKDPETEGVSSDEVNTVANPRSAQRQSGDSSRAETIRDVIGSMRRSEAGLVVSLQQVINDESEYVGDDIVFLDHVLSALQEGRDQDLVDAPVMSALKTLRCTNALCELVFDYESVRDPGLIKRNVASAMAAHEIELEMISDGPNNSGDELHVFLVREGFADYVLNTLVTT